MTKSEDMPTTRMHVRIYDPQTLRDIDALVASGRFGSKTEVVSKCVELALPELMGIKQSTEENNVLKDGMRKQAVTLRDIAVVSNITFNLVSSLFSERAFQLEGGRASAADFKEGLFEKLPPHYQDILNELMR